MALHNPPHPGGIDRRQCLEPLGTSVSQTAERLGAASRALSDLLHGRAGVSAEIAIRVSKVFGSTPERWPEMQLAQDLWQARTLAEELAVERFRPA